MVRLLNLAITGGRRLYWLPRTRATIDVDIGCVEAERDDLGPAPPLIDEQVEHAVDHRIAHPQLVLIRLANP